MNGLSIGSAAATVTPIDGEAKVIGVTSRGLFLAIKQRVLFISFERWRGPLTITLGRSSEELRALKIGDTATFANNRVIFPTIEITLATAPEGVWQAPVPVTSPGPHEQQRKTVRQIAGLVTARKPDQGFSPPLAALLDLPVRSALSADQAPVLSVLRALRQALRENDLPATQTNIDQLLGQGGGLTPSGDDCVLGLLLMLNRWQAQREWSRLNQAVINAAYQKTTTLSANLIECAAAGQADERLLKVADGIATGQPAIAECVECVLEWGNSSGIDALAGMAMAV